MQGCCVCVTRTRWWCHEAGRSTISATRSCTCSARHCLPRRRAVRAPRPPENASCGEQLRLGADAGSGESPLEPELVESPTGPATLCLPTWTLMTWARGHRRSTRPTTSTVCSSASSPLLSTGLPHGRPSRRVTSTVLRIMQIERDTVVPGPPERAFALVDDLSAYPAWMDLVHDVEEVPPTEATADLERRAPGTGRSVRTIEAAPHGSTVARADASGRLRTRGSRRPPAFAVDLCTATLEPEASGTGDDPADDDAHLRRQPVDRRRAPTSAR